MREHREVYVSREQQIWQAYRTKLYRFVLGRVNDEAVAEDIVHDVLTRAYARRDTLRDHSKFQPWLYQISRNAIVDYYRTRKPLEELPNSLVDEKVDASDNVEEELARCLMPLIEELPAHYRQAMMLAEFEGFTQREVASKLGLSLSGAKSRVQRARRMLEALLLECCHLEFNSRGSITSYEPKEKCNAC